MPQVHSVAFVDGKLALCGDSRGKLTLLHSASGEIVWQKDMGAMASCDP